MSTKQNKFLTTVFATVIMTGAAVNLAQAGDSKATEAKELKLFKQAKITLSEAIKSAEQETGGKAMEAEIDDESNAVQFEIEILKDGKVYEVKVDGMTGKILKVELDDESKASTEQEIENEQE